MSTGRGLPSDEVAEDFKTALEDLAVNSRYEISNLTVIAKENTEHAMAISRVLENHIKGAPPSRKLPALYVLDSIVKNVGTPYTLFLGRNLYNTFMNAYTLVDSGIRKKLDEMLKTWKEPIPGSMETRPVFPTDITRNIENALIKARTAAFQEQQKHNKALGLPPRPQVIPPPTWRNTPTPPQNMPFQPPPNASQVIPSGLQSNMPQGIPKGLPQGVSLQNNVQYPVNGYFSTFNTGYTNTPPPQQSLTTPASTLSLPVSLPLSLPISQSTPAMQYSTAPTQSNIPSLATLQNVSSIRVPDTTALLASLRAAGIIGGSNNSTSSLPNQGTAKLNHQPVVSAPQAPLSLTASLLMPKANAQFVNIASLRSQTPASNGYDSPEIELTTASMKIPRRHLVANIYNSLPSQCSSCGRRFPATKEGKDRKSKHLDWHFRTNQRLNESANKSKNRSWYVDEMSWIKTTSEDPSLQPPAPVHPSANEPLIASGTRYRSDSPSAQSNQPFVEFIKAPSSPTTQSTPCPICQEKFENVWSDREQDWVWRDARKVGGRIYHASCYGEAVRGQQESQNKDPKLGKRAGTPSGGTVLGKRKLEATVA